MELKLMLDRLVNEYNTPAFISPDPISLPHVFTEAADREIIGLFAAVFAWGQRTTILQKGKELITRMEKRPHDFITSHRPKDLKRMLGFKHRTFNDTDLLYFISFLHYWYAQEWSLETAFTLAMKPGDPTIEGGLNGFRKIFFGHADYPVRTQKHPSSPEHGSACKRLNMFLRWMVRKDDKGVDFGIWNRINASQLICPLDLHVQRVATRLGLLVRTQSDWKAATELTAKLREFDPEDPVKYDFALFSLGIAGLNR